MSGTFVAERHPAAVTRKRAVTTSPRSVRTSQVFDASSNVAATTRVLELEVAAEVEPVRDVVEVPLDLRLFRVPARPFPLLPRAPRRRSSSSRSSRSRSARRGSGSRTTCRPRPHRPRMPAPATPGRSATGGARRARRIPRPRRPRRNRVPRPSWRSRVACHQRRRSRRAITSSPPRPANASTRSLGRGARWGVPRRRPPRRGRSFRSCRRR